MNISVYRILELMEEQKIRANNLEMACGLAKSSIFSWKSGKCNPSMKALAKVADYFEVSVDYLLGNTDERQNAKTPNVDLYPVGDMQELPILGVVRAGVGGVVEQEHIGTEFATKKAMHGYPVQDLFYLHIKGSSMYPRIAEGDLALVHRQTSVDSGSLAVVLVNHEEAVVKKVYYGSDWIELLSINPAYPPRKFVGEEVQKVFVIGKVISVLQTWE